MTPESLLRVKNTVFKQQLGGIRATETIFLLGSAHEVSALWTSGYVNTTSLSPNQLKRP